MILSYLPKWIKMDDINTNQENAKQDLNKKPLHNH